MLTILDKGTQERHGLTERVTDPRREECQCPFLVSEILEMDAASRSGSINCALVNGDDRHS